MNAVSRALILTVLPAGLLAQSARPARHIVRGVVYDSVRAVPLAGAVVQALLLDSSRSPGALKGPPRTFTALTDSAGSFQLSDLPDGVFAVGFQHDALNALGLETPIIPLELSGDTSVRLDLAIPSGAVVRAQVCPGRPDETVEGVLVGYVLHARTGAPMRSAAVSAQWIQMDIDRGKLQSAARQAVAAVYEEGRYRVCGIPSDGPVLIRVTLNGFHTVEMEMDFADVGVARRDFFLSDTAAMRGNATIAVRVLNDSGGPMSFGRAVVASLGREVPVHNGVASVRDVPPGTWVVSVRALGYRPASLVVQAVANDTVMPTVTMEPVAIRLDPVNIVAARTRRDRATLTAIEQRLRVASGTLIQRDNLSLRSAIYASDAVRVARGFNFKGPTEVESRGGCKTTRPDTIVPARGKEIAVYLDGVRFPGGLESVNRLVPPSEILAIEAYPDVGSAPFLWRTNNTCAVIAFWTKH